MVIFTIFCVVVVYHVGILPIKYKSTALKNNGEKWYQSSSSTLYISSLGLHKSSAEDSGPMFKPCIRRSLSTIERWVFPALNSTLQSSVENNINKFVKEQKINT